MNTLLSLMTSNLLEGRGKLDAAGIIIGLPNLALVTRAAAMLAVDGSKC